MTTLHLRKSGGRSPLRLGLLRIPLALACFALAPAARAVLPAPDGGYPGNNTAEGDNALFNLDTSQGFDNTAIGFQSLFSNTTGGFNTATGIDALPNNTTGGYNTAIGGLALIQNTTGSNNTASGFNALGFNTTGSYNIVLGDFAGNNLTTGDSNIDIGNEGIADESGIIRIGTIGTHTAAFIAGISETPITTGVRVGISPDGQLGVRASAVRFKEGIKPMDKASEVILALKPVSFHYKKALDPKGLPQFGLVAEEVAKVDPDLVVSDVKGKPFTVRYDEVNAMLLNEFLKEHRKVENLEATVARQQEDFQKKIAALKSQIQKVSDRMEVSTAATRMVVDNQ